MARTGRIGISTNRYTAVGLLCLFAIFSCRGQPTQAKDPLPQAKARAEALLQAWNRGEAGDKHWDLNDQQKQLFGPLTYQFVSGTTNPIEVHLRYQIKSVTKGGLPIEKLWDIVLVPNHRAGWLVDRLEDPYSPTWPASTPRRLRSLEVAWADCRKDLEVQQLRGETAALYLVICFQGARYTVDEALDYIRAQQNVPVESVYLEKAAMLIKKEEGR